MQFNAVTLLSYTQKHRPGNMTREACCAVESNRRLCVVEWSSYTLCVNAGLLNPLARRQRAVLAEDYTRRQCVGVMARRYIIRVGCRVTIPVLACCPMYSLIS